MKEDVTLDAVLHRGAQYIAIRFADRPDLRGIVSKISSVRWSNTHRCWLLPLSKENYRRILAVFSGGATIDNSPLRQYLLSRNAAFQVMLDKNVQRSEASDGEARAIMEKGAGAGEEKTIDERNIPELEKMVELLKLKSYSPSTIKTYRNELATFLRTIGRRPAVEMTEDQIKKYLLYCHEKLGLSENTLHSRINALKFYYEQVLKRDRFFWNVPRPKRHLQLPKLLNEDELIRLFNALTNKKHKAMLFTAYSAGLRVSEIVNLKISDIDSGRMQILIRRAKGKKDRYVNLSPVLLDILREYVKTYKPRPKEFLFESEQTFAAYPVRTVQQIFSNAKRKAGIRKEVGVHSLRHSFATQLLDKGTDIRYIKDILGHFNIKTTERYLHVSKAKLVNIVSPFDDLWRTQDIQW